MAQLAPSPTPLAIFPDFIAQKAETVVMKGEYIGDSLNVSLLNGPLLLSIKAESMSLSHRKHVYDNKGKHICNIRKETWNLSGNAYWIESPTDENVKLFEMKSGFSLSGNKFTGTFKNATSGQMEELFFKNNPFGSHGTIENKKTGTPVANIDREWLKVRKEYHVMVAAGVDIALIVGMIVCIDDRERSSSNAGVTASVAAGA